MRPHLDIAHEGNLGTANRVRMTFDENSTTFLMSVLTDLYSDPELAVIREYSTNAVDSHAEAGHSDPIEVELPSSLRPVFIVRDHGVGMSLETINEQFSKYGWSSKRESDAAVGMLGLGCKSALAYTSQFTLVSNHDGLQVTALITREEDGGGAVQVVDTCATDLPNGVEVRIPVKYVDSFVKRAMAFFRFWDRGTVLVDGVEPEPIWERSDTLVLDPDVILVTGHGGIEQDYVVMGGVPYPVRYPFEGLTPNNASRKAIVRVPIGTVNFAPSREALQDTKRTKEALVEAREFIATGIQRLAQADIDDAPTHGEAMKRTARWRGAGVSSFMYRGEPVPFQFTVDGGFMAWYVSNTEMPADRMYSAQYDKMLEYIHIVGAPTNKVPGTLKRKVQMWVEEQVEAGLISDEHHLRAISYAEPIPGQWLSTATMVDYETIKAVRLPSTPRAAGPRPKSKVWVLNGGNTTTAHDTIPDGAVWVEATHYNRNRLAQNLAGQVPIVVLAAHQVAKFQRENPQIKHVKDWVAAQVARFQATITPEESWFIRNQYDNKRSALLGLRGKKLRDHEVAAVIERLVAINVDKPNAVQKWQRVAVAVGVDGPKMPVPAKLGEAMTMVYDRYPLLQHLGSRHTDAVIEYIDAVYAMRQAATEEH